MLIVKSVGLVNIRLVAGEIFGQQITIGLPQPRPMAKRKEGNGMNVNEKGNRGI